MDQHGRFQFTTNIDGVDSHFIHVRSKNPNALPVIITHGWPGSMIEELKIIDPLTNPTALWRECIGLFLRGDSVAASPRVFGKARHDRLGSCPHRARLDHADEAPWIHGLCRARRDWGNAVTEQMALLAPPELLGIHTNMPATIPDDIAKPLQFGNPAPSGLSPDERHAYDQLDSFYKHGLGYAQEMANRPQTLYGIEDLPVGLGGLDARPRRSQ